jgi:hypothetical protein
MINLRGFVWHRHQNTYLLMLESFLSSFINWFIHFNPFPDAFPHTKHNTVGPYFSNSRDPIRMAMELEESVYFERPYFLTLSPYPECSLTMVGAPILQ